MCGTPRDTQAGPLRVLVVLKRYLTVHMSMYTGGYYVPLMCSFAVQLHFFKFL